MNLLMTSGCEYQPCSGLTSFTTAGNAKAGVSVGRILSPEYEKHEGYQWYAMIATYHREHKAADHLLNNGVYVYLPTRKDGTSFIPNTLFIYTDFPTAESFVRYNKDSAGHLDYLHFMYDRTTVNSKGKNPPITVPDSQMDNFIRLMSIGDDDTGLLPRDDVRFREGDEVEVIGGEFKGIRGRIARVHGTTRVVVTLEGVCYAAAAYIAKRYIKPLSKE